VRIREISHHTTLVEVSGELDMATAPRLSAVLDSIDPSSDGSSGMKVVLDLGALRFMDCCGFRPIDAAARRLGAQDAILMVVSATPPVRRVFDLLGRSDLVGDDGGVSVGERTAGRDEATTARIIG
jgi:anti-anti-sigma factor